MSILAHATPWGLFCSESRSKTGSIIRHGGHVRLVKNATATRWDRRNESNDAEFVMTCIGAVIDEVSDEWEVDVAADARAWLDTDWRREAPSWLSAGGRWAWPSTGRLYIASMVGRNAAPKGVDKKSLGRSTFVSWGSMKPSKDDYTFDGLWYGATRKESNDVIGERITIEVCGLWPWAWSKSGFGPMTNLRGGTKSRELLSCVMDDRWHTLSAV